MVSPGPQSNVHALPQTRSRPPLSKRGRTGVAPSSLSALLRIIEKSVANPAVSADKLKHLLDMHREMDAERAGPHLSPHSPNCRRCCR